MSGTSMAAPHVSGLAALYMEQFPNKSTKQIWELIENKARPIEGIKYRDIGNGFNTDILMITYLAVLKKKINLKKLEVFLKNKGIKLAAHYKTIGVVKAIESNISILESEFQEYFISIEEEKDNLTI